MILVSRGRGPIIQQIWTQSCLIFWQYSNAKISKFIQDGLWSWPYARSSELVQIQMQLFDMHLGGEGVVEWLYTASKKYSTVLLVVQLGTNSINMCDISMSILLGQNRNQRQYFFFLFFECVFVYIRIWAEVLKRCLNHHLIGEWSSEIEQA